MKEAPMASTDDFGDFESGQDCELSSPVSDDEFGEFEQNTNSSNDPSKSEELRTVPTELHGEEYRTAIQYCLHELAKSIDSALQCNAKSNTSVSQSDTKSNTSASQGDTNLNTGASQSDVKLNTSASQGDANLNTGASQSDVKSEVKIPLRFSSAIRSVDSFRSGSSLLYKRRAPNGFLRSTGVPISLASKTESVQQRFLTRLGINPAVLWIQDQPPPPLMPDSAAKSSASSSGDSKTTESMEFTLTNDPGFDLEFLVQSSAPSITSSNKSSNETAINRNTLSQLFEGLVSEQASFSTSSKAEWDEFVQPEEAEEEEEELFDAEWLQQLQSTHADIRPPAELAPPPDDLDWGKFEEAPVQESSKLDPFSLLLPLFRKTKEAPVSQQLVGEEDWGLFQS
eukprot:g8172.t1